MTLATGALVQTVRRSHGRCTLTGWFAPSSCWEVGGYRYEGEEEDSARSGEAPAGAGATSAQTEAITEAAEE